MNKNKNSRKRDCLQVTVITRELRTYDSKTLSEKQVLGVHMKHTWAVNAARNRANQKWNERPSSQ